MLKTTLIAAAAAGFFALPLSAQTTWTVNASGGAQFAAIAPAIAAAAPGDRIEVQGPGPYAAFVLGKGLDVEAVAGAVCATIEVVGVPAGQSARVAGFGIDQQNNGFVSVRNCNGPVLLVALGLAGTSWQVSVGNPGLQVLGSTNVFVDGCQFQGHAGSVGGVGVEIDGSRAVLVNCSIHGGVNVAGSGSVGNSGVSGVSVVNQGHAMLRAVLSQGGPSSSASVVGGNGGDGVQAGSGVALVLGGCDLRGMPGGWGPFIQGQPGEAARGNVRFTGDTLLTGATSTATPIPSRPVLSTPPTTAIGSNYVLTVTGAANQFVFLGFDLAHDYVPLPQFDGALVLTPSTALFTVIGLDAAGNGSFGLGIPNTPAALRRDLYAQGIADVGGALVLTAPAHTRTL